MFADPILARIAEEAERLTGGKCALRVQGDVTPTLVIELPDNSIVRGRLLNKRLTEFCEREGLGRRYVVVGGSEPRFVPKSPPIPDGWPADPDAE